MRFLFVDSITHLIPGSKTLGMKHVTPQDDYLIPDVSSGKLCFVPALVGETVGQLAAWNAMVSCDFKKRPVAGIAERAVLHRPVYVGETLSLHSEIQKLDESMIQYVGEARVGDELVFELSALGPMLPMTDFIDESLVRHQFESIDSSGGIQKPRLPDSAADITYAHPESVAKLVHFDRVMTHEEGVSITAEKYIAPDAPYFHDHFPRKPVLPMTILLECIMNLADTFVRAAHVDNTYIVQEMRRIKMNDFVLPGDILTTELSLKSHQHNQLVLKCRVSRSGKRVCLLEVLMVPRGPCA